MTAFQEVPNSHTKTSIGDTSDPGCQATTAHIVHIAIPQASDKIPEIFTSIVGPYLVGGSTHLKLLVKLDHFPR